MRIVKKTLKGDLLGQTGFKAVKAARKPKPEAAAPPAASPPSLDELAGDDLVVLTQPLRPREGRPIPLGTAESKKARPAEDPVEQKAVAAVAFQPLQDGAALPLARAVLTEALYKDIGARGSKMQHPTGTTFQLNPKWGDGVVHAPRSVLVPLKAGRVASHSADLAVELDNRAQLVLDLVASSVTPTEMKALAFDALQLDRVDRCFKVLVFVRAPGGMPQEQAEAIGHGYDFAFGIDEADVHSELKFAGLRNRIQTWLAAARRVPQASPPP
ncbi:MAG TPA: hypothetical protein VHI93_00370 [Candidatus Thermoplasmatota archaeon]|nr:hypothetical protein [Candidatus Thermoplasmatota archaeon]